MNSIPDRSLAARVASNFGPDILIRGANYAASGRVLVRKADSRNLRATVRGETTYLVAIELVDSHVQVSCNCPHYTRGHFCKHLWASILQAEEKGYLKALVTAPALLERGAAPDDMGLIGLRSSKTSSGPSRDSSRSEPSQRAEGPSNSWKKILRAIRAGTPGGRRRLTGYGAVKLLYIANAETILRTGRFTLNVYATHRKKNGSWADPIEKIVRKQDLGELPDLEDQRIFDLLFGAEGSPYSTSLSSSHRFVLTSSIVVAIMPRLCQTGRFFLQASSQDRAFRPLQWDEGLPWDVRLRLERAPKAKGWIVKGCLEREKKTLDLSDPTLLLSSGHLFLPGKVAAFRFDGNYRWITEMRRSKGVPVGDDEVESFIDELYDLPGSPSVDLPDSVRPREVEGTPQPLIQITPRQDRSGRTSLPICLSFIYKDSIVAASDPRPLIYRSQERLLIRRNQAAEEGAVEVMRGLGMRPVFREDEDIDLEIDPGTLPRAVVAMIGRGWKVEAEGSIYRKPGSFQMSVRSGIDWFDLEGGVLYGDEVVPFPRLLAARRSGEGFVRLDDGSLGILPEEWLKKKALLLGTGETAGEALRFQPCQAFFLDTLLAAEGTPSCDDTFRRLRKELRRFDGVLPVDPPGGFRGTLRPYQRLALGWTQLLGKLGLGGCLADDMGLGKTVTVLALLEGRRRRGAGRSLVVVPRSLIFNWKAEAQRFAPSLRVVEHLGQDRTKTAEELPEADVLLTTYGTLRQDAAFLKDVQFDYVILDEAQMIKNASSVTAKAARLLKGRSRLALSGTPIENHVGELWSLMEFLNPGLLGRVSVFRAATEPGREEESGERELLVRALRPFLLRRTKAQVAPELPKKTEQTLTVDLDPRERNRYDELREHYRQSLLGDSRSWNRVKFNVLESLLRLRQAACHPGLLNPKHRGDTSSKLEVLVERVREVLDEGHKVLVFSQFTSFLDLVRRRLEKEQFSYEYLDGKTRDRAARVERFQGDPDCRIFLVSLKAGGLGLNLTAAEYVFLLDPWWNPAVEAQAIDRTHRIGQDRPVFAYRLVARGTVEEKILELQKSKRALADSILVEDRSFLRDLTRDDLALLLS